MLYVMHLIPRTVIYFCYVQQGLSGYPELLKAELSGVYIENNPICLCIMVLSFLVDFADDFFYLTSTTAFGTEEKNV